jgi:hypothetical protein
MSLKRAASNDRRHPMRGVAMDLQFELCVVVRDELYFLRGVLLVTSHVVSRTETLLRVLCR